VNVNTACANRSDRTVPLQQMCTRYQSVGGQPKSFPRKIVFSFLLDSILDIIIQSTRCCNSHQLHCDSFLVYITPHMKLEYYCMHQQQLIALICLVYITISIAYKILWPFVRVSAIRLCLIFPYKFFSLRIQVNAGSTRKAKQLSLECGMMAHDELWLSL
jgi:hypothetical protein